MTQIIWIKKRRLEPLPRIIPLTIYMIPRCNNFPERCRGCTLSSLATTEGDIQLKPGDTLAVKHDHWILLNSYFDNWHLPDLSAGEVSPIGEESCGGGEQVPTWSKYGGRASQTSPRPRWLSWGILYQRDSWRRPGLVGCLVPLVQPNSATLQSSFCKVLSSLWEKQESNQDSFCLAIPRLPHRPLEKVSYTQFMQVCSSC